MTRLDPTRSPNPAPCALVVGGRGFIGGFIVAALRARGFAIRTLARPQGRTLGAEDIPGDLTRMLEPEDWDAALAGVSVVVNAAGILREDGRQSFETIHVRAPLALARACAKRGIRFVQVSALGHVDDGGFIESKHRFDAQLLDLPIEAIVLRPSVVYSHSGSYGGTSLLRALAAFPWRNLLPGDGHWTFQPICAEDLANIVTAACQQGERGIYELGCATPISLADYQQHWRRWLQIPGARNLQVPLTLVRLHVTLGQWLGKGPVNRTIWAMLLRGNRTVEGSYEQALAAFGVPIRPLPEVLASQPSQMQDRWAAQMYFLAPWLLWSVIVLWLGSALAGWLTPGEHILALTRDSILAQAHPVELARLAAGIDLVLGLWLALGKRRRPVVLLMILSLAVYLVGFGLGLPHLWLDPLGGLLKNLVLLPALAVLWVLVDSR